MPNEGRASFVLGTAQLGAAYGRTNTIGALSDVAAAALLEAAHALGVREFDTARAYGASEERIGWFLRQSGAGDVRVLTKLDPLKSIGRGADASIVREAVRRSVETSLDCLGVTYLPVLMLHSAAHLSAFGGAVVDELMQCRAEGLIGEIGASVNTPTEFRHVLSCSAVRHVQLPYNLIDRRWAEMPDLAGQPSIHVRSIYLQGLLAHPQTAAWPVAAGGTVDELVRALQVCVHELGRASMQDLALAYVRSQHWVDGCVIGVERIEQLEDNVTLFAQPAMTPDECAFVRKVLPRVPDALVQPWCW